MDPEYISEEDEIPFHIEIYVEPMIVCVTNI
jgi:hypothetical protein